MTFTNKFKDLKKFYTIYIIIILFFNTALISNLRANSFKISEIEYLYQKSFNRILSNEFLLILIYETLKSIYLEERK